MVGGGPAATHTPLNFGPPIKKLLARPIRDFNSYERQHGAVMHYS